MNSTNEYRNMKNHFCLNLFFLLYLFFCAGCKQHISDSAAKANEALFTQLDSLIDNSDKLILQKEERIEALKHSLRQSKAFEKQYELNQAIYQEYRVYDADSAMKYTTQSLDLARQYHDKNREIESLLAYIIHSGFISGYQNRYGDNLKPPTNVYHRMTA